MQRAPEPGALRQCVLDDGHAAERGEFVQHEQQAVPVREDRLAFVVADVDARQPAHDHGQHQANERPQPNLVGARHENVERHRLVVVHQVGDAEIARSRVACDQRVSEQFEISGRRAVDRRALFRLAVQLIPAGRSDDRVALPIEMAIVDHLLIQRVSRAGWIR